MDISYILNHLGEDRKNYFNAIAPPIIQSSNFAFDSVIDFREKIAQEFETNVYTRGNNPTVEILRKKLAALEHAVVPLGPAQPVVDVIDVLQVVPAKRF